MLLTLRAKYFRNQEERVLNPDRINLNRKNLYVITFTVKKHDISPNGFTNLVGNSISVWRRVAEAAQLAE
jgi:hypothetical protein